MSSPFGRDPALGSDIVTTHGWATLVDGRVGLAFATPELPRDEAGWGQIAKGWRVTLPTGEQAIVRDFGEAPWGIQVDLAPDDLPRMRARIIRAKRAPRIKIQIERLDENVILLASGGAVPARDFR